MSHARAVLGTLDRGLIPQFGVIGQGVHLNGLVRRPDGLHVWVGIRARNKAVLVITHDDRYFSGADRLIRLDYGQITGEGPGPAGLAAPSLVGVHPSNR